MPESREATKNTKNDHDGGSAPVASNTIVGEGAEFRAWHIKQGSMWYVRYVDFDDQTAFISRWEKNEQTGKKERVSNCKMRYSGADADIIAMRYSGFDEGKQRIYQDDIFCVSYECNVGFHELIGVVDFCESAGMWMIDFFQHGFSIPLVDMFENHSYQLVGNAHDKPELLEFVKVRSGEMTLERAREIVAAMVGHKCWEVGIGKPILQSLADLSLAEMVEANRMVREVGAVEMKCADRLVAALYVLYHYDPAMTNHPIVHDGQKLVDVLPVISDIEAETEGEGD